jgi:hypothetical protein
MRAVYPSPKLVPSKVSHFIRYLQAELDGALWGTCVEAETCFTIKNIANCAYSMGAKGQFGSQNAQKPHIAAFVQGAAEF